MVPSTGSMPAEIVLNDFARSPVASVTTATRIAAASK